ncbi:helix-turn-helix domain-containing protein, partial [Parafrankia soli]|uniref:helix-turn-helix domain-containing protein n=1 Tax=Parafrankia soli TaxID=2599596 RepID=UPI003B587100
MPQLRRPAIRRADQRIVARGLRPSRRGQRIDGSVTCKGVIVLAVGSRVVKRAYRYRFYPTPEQA